MAKIEDVDLLPNSRKMMMAALLQRMNQPQPSPWGAAANALSMGLMGLIERQDDVKAADTAMSTSALLDRATQGSGTPMGATIIPGAASEAPSAKALASALHPTSYAVGDETIPGPRPNPLAQYAPEFREKFPELRTAAADQGVTFDAPSYGSVGSVRTQPQQDALFAQGRTAPGPIVTGTRNSNHLTGNAADVVPTNGTTPDQIGATVSALTKDDPRFSNMRSGATFKNLYDPLHVEIPRGQQQPMQMAQAPQAQPSLQPPGIIKDLEAQARAAYQSGDMRRAKAWADQANALKMEYFQQQQKLQFDAASKLNPTYSDRNPNLDIKQMPNGEWWAINPKDGRPVRRVETPGSGQRPTITLPTGQVLTMPEGANEQTWRESVSREVGQMTFPKPVDPSAAGRQAMADAAKAPLEKHKHVLLDDFDTKKTAQYYAFQAGAPGQGEVGLAYNALSARIQAGVYAATGSAAPESEEKRLMSTYAPTPWDSKEMRAQKLQMLDDYLANYNENVKRGREMPGQQQQPQQGNTAPEGTVVHGRNGETLIKRNGQWVQQ